MTDTAFPLMPSQIRRSLVQFGKNIRIARLKRQLTIDMMLERTGMSKGTYQKIEKGDPTVALGGYAMCLLALGFGPILGEVAGAAADDTGLILDQERLPKRVRRSRRGPDVR
jgi:transcriptional regulator with XRE-family HTH domain